MFRRSIPIVVLALLGLALSDPGIRALATHADRPDQAVLQIPPLEPSGDAPQLSIAQPATYLSPITRAPRPFTHVLLRWQAQVPLDADLHLELRASADGQSWSDWREVLPDVDLWQPSDGPDVTWSQIMYAGDQAAFWQVRASVTPAPDGSLPQLRTIDVNTADAQPGLTSIDPQPQAPTLSGVARPPVRSRTQWGSPDGQGSRVAPAYMRVTHLVVHHTVDDSNLRPEQDFDARVRATWQFHTFTRGWGDIGYNYLVAPTGVIYEGRAGGDDAVGFHDTANYGSMGVALLGTYSTLDPPAAALDSLTALLAWKAGQRDIDPLGRAWYYGCSVSSFCRSYTPNAVVETIAGHRTVTPNRTTCPGDRTAVFLPGVRTRVAQRLAGGDAGGGWGQTVPDNGDLIVDELERGPNFATGFALSNAVWRSAECGSGGHTYYTYTTAGQPENSATWRPTIPASGIYRVYAHIPQGCGLGIASGQAGYRVVHAGGTAVVQVDQTSADDWVLLGTFGFDAGTAGAVELYDNTGEPYSTDPAVRRVLFFDAIAWERDEAFTSASATIERVQYDRLTLPAGEPLQVTFTVRNTGPVPIRGQPPQASLDAAGQGYVYRSSECVWGIVGSNTPSFNKETGRFRVALGIVGVPDPDPARPCNAFGGRTSGYPWRWGLNSDIAPGATGTVQGYLVFDAPGSYQLQAALVQEYVRYHTEGQVATTITVLPEAQAPDATMFGADLRPRARVYQLGSIPDNLLARTPDAREVPRGAYVGSFAWDGGLIDWGNGGPLGLSDRFVIDQVRVFRAPVAGTYSFQVTSDDGGWLWINGQPVVNNSGIHGLSMAEGQVQLPAGTHVLAFRGFERSGSAGFGYGWRLPGGSTYTTITDGPGSGAAIFGGAFVQPPDLVIAADDFGGTISTVRWSLNDSQTIETPQPVVHVGRLVPATYTLRYTPVDGHGRSGAEQIWTFRVRGDIQLRQVYMPQVQR